MSNPYIIPTRIWLPIGGRRLVRLAINSEAESAADIELRVNRRVMDAQKGSFIATAPIHERDSESATFMIGPDITSQLDHDEKYLLQAFFLNGAVEDVDYYWYQVEALNPLVAA